jgi:16S rRNA C1402 (ribose-2'-O) methylase RsmI
MNRPTMIQRLSIFGLLWFLATTMSAVSFAQMPEQAPRFDPYMPGELNERALYALQMQDASTAVILLERAYRLNPNSPDIKANLDIVRQIAKEKTAVELRGEVIHLDAIGNPIQENQTSNVPAIWPEPKP